MMHVQQLASQAESCQLVNTQVTSQSNIHQRRCKEDRLLKNGWQCKLKDLAVRTLSVHLRLLIQKELETYGLLPGTSPTRETRLAIDSGRMPFKTSQIGARQAMGAKT
jgi:hypothetical protein